MDSPEASLGAALRLSRRQLGWLAGTLLALPLLFGLRLALTRLDDNFKRQWTATLPYHDLRNRYESPGHLLLYGIVQQTEKGVTGTTEHLVALNLSDGKTQSWNVPAEKRVD